MGIYADNSVGSLSLKPLIKAALIIAAVGICGCAGVAIVGHQLFGSRAYEWPRPGDLESAAIFFLEGGFFPRQDNEPIFLVRDSGSKPALYRLGAVNLPSPAESFLFQDAVWSQDGSSVAIRGGISVGSEYSVIFLYAYDFRLHEAIVPRWFRSTGRTLQPLEVWREHSSRIEMLLEARGGVAKTSLSSETVLRGTQTIPFFSDLE